MHHKPKSEVIKELKLCHSKGLSHDGDLTIESLVDGWGEANMDGNSCHVNMSGSSSVQMARRNKKLLQFDKSYRPAFYGIWPKKSIVAVNVSSYLISLTKVINHQPYDQKADVFSFAIVLWELVTAKVPYDTLTPLQATLGFRQVNLTSVRLAIKLSHVVGPRNPLKKDPDLDYDVDSDEEWEEEDPGESLSDCDKDGEESADEACLKADEEDESDDGFFVPDGYLSENEGVQTDRDRSLDADDGRSSPSCKPEAECVEYTAWIQQQKYLHNLTEHALHRNQPLIISNLKHEKASFFSKEELAVKLEQMCLQALAMHVCPGALPVEVPSDNVLPEEYQIPSSKGNSVPAGAAATIPDSDLPKIDWQEAYCVCSSSMSILETYNSYESFVKKVGGRKGKTRKDMPKRGIRGSPLFSPALSMNKVLESLQQKLPNIPKSHLRNKVHEISDFVDNRWQVKKEIMDKLGIPVSARMVLLLSVINIAPATLLCLARTDCTTNLQEKVDRGLQL
ncbi:hypothetical protein Ancab_024541 [Ancistrocladus abbreviatus]